MALFEKKFCDVCGEKIGLLGNRKLEDGNLCKECASKLSPFFSERKHSTVDEIKEQLAYREANQGQVQQFHPTATYGDHTKVMVDQNMGCFIVTNANNWREKNPDVIPVSKVTNCVLDVKENRNEIYREIQKDGHTERVSFNPPKYEYHYDFDLTISVDHPYFDEIRIDLCSMSDRPTSVNDARYQRLTQVAQQIEAALLPGRAPMGMGMNQMGGMGNMNMGMNNMGGMGNMNMGMNNMGMNNMNNQQNMMNAVQQVAAMAGMGGMNQMGGQMNNMNNMNMGMNNMGMNGMNQMNGQMGNMGMNNMNQMGGQMNNMGMNQMNQMGGQMGNMGMNQMNQMGGQMGNMGMNQNMMNQSAPMQQNPGAGQQMSGPWTCACGTANTGAFCEGCGNPRP